MGNVIGHRYASGWLITASQLSKDAKGYRELWNNKPEPERSKLRVFEPEQLVSRLIDFRTLAPAESLPIPGGYLTSDEVCVVLTEHTTYWAVPLLDPVSGIRSAVAFFSVSDGAIIDSQIIRPIIEVRTAAQ